MGAIEEEINLKQLDKILESATKGNVAELIPILQEIQKAYGYLPEAVLAELGGRMKFPASRIYGVATFYEQFYLEPHGRHIVKCCRGTACHVKHGPEIINAVAQSLNIEPGQTTDDMQFSFETVACLGTCFLAPVMMVNNDYYGNLKRNQIGDILKQYK
jgi:NADH:ubiquinone oxidoreductase subunit E